MEKRLALSDVQVANVPNVTSDGFRLQKLPPALHAKLRTWYHATHARDKVRESRQTRVGKGKMKFQIDFKLKKKR